MNPSGYGIETFVLAGGEGKRLAPALLHADLFEWTRHQSFAAINDTRAVFQ